MRRVSLLCGILLLTAGCLHLPKSQRSFTPRTVVTAPFSTVWDATLKAAQDTQSTVLAQEQESGFLLLVNTALWPGHPVYINVYVKADAENRSTRVLFFAHVKEGRYTGEAEGPFFDRLREIIQGG